MKKNPSRYSNEENILSLGLVPWQQSLKAQLPSNRFKLKKKYIKKVFFSKPKKPEFSGLVRSVSDDASLKWLKTGLIKKFICKEEAV